MLNCLQAPVIAKYLLNTNANDASGNGYDGELTDVLNTTDRFGNINAAIAFDADNGSVGILPSSLVDAMKNSFSFSFWFKSTMIANIGNNWYNGNSLFDAEVCGETNDWGTALIDGGKVCFGIGNPDAIIKSTSSNFNDGSWHFVSAVRDQTAGSITLYVDGVFEGSTSSVSVNDLTAPSVIGLGRNSCSSNATFTGSLDDVIVYGRVLSNTEVGNLYSILAAAVLPLKWISFTGTVTSANIVALQWEVAESNNNDHFEIESSSDGIHFSVEGQVRDNQGNGQYSFSGSNTRSGTNFYRIKQVDKNGNYSYSKIIKITVSGNASSFSLQGNPVAEELVIINHNQAMVQRIQIVDVSGKILSDQVVNLKNTTLKSNAHNLVSGYYLLRIFTSSGVSVLPLIKQ
ncbi:MAG: LamG-like jellyroll fold domain-containing protein [Ferruginibacter sp.]